MNDTLTIEINGDRRSIAVPPEATAEDVNAAIAVAFPGYRPETLPRALTPDEAEAHRADTKVQHRSNLLSTILSAPAEDQKAALAAAKRKGWGLEGMSTAKLEEVARQLRELVDEPDDW